MNKQEEITRYIVLAIGVANFIIGFALLIAQVVIVAVILMTLGIVITILSFINGKKKMRLDDKEFDAAIFDMDGTLIDSTGIWHEIDKEFFAKRKLELPEDYAQHIVHLGLKEAARYTKETYHIEESIEEIMQEWHDMSLDMYKYQVQLKPGVLEVLKLFKRNGIKMAIATANDEPLYLPCIQRLGLDQYFDEIADVNTAKEGKQSAKIYLDLAEKLGSKPERTLVLEDMPTCVKTAFTSGFITVAVDDNASKDYVEEKTNNSHLFIKSFDELISKLN